MDKRPEKGIMGLGALIIFIALLLVVGVAGIVLVTSGGSLQQKSMIKTSQAKKGVTSGLEVMSVVGTDASVVGGSPHTLEDLHVMVRLLPGTVTLNLNSTIIYVETNDFEQTSMYGGHCTEYCNAQDATYYKVYYLKEGTNHENGYINLGTVGKLAVRLPQGLNEDSDIKLFIIPGAGPQTVLKMLTPPTMITQQVTIWPVT